MLFPAADRAAGALGVPPFGARHVGPPVRDVAEIDAPLRLLEHERPWHQQRRVGVGVRRGVGRLLRNRDVTRRTDEPLVLSNRHRMLVYPERADAHLSDRALFLIELLGAHAERPARHVGHVLHDERRDRGTIVLGFLRHRLIPHQTSGRPVQRDQMRVVGDHEDFVPEQRHSAIRSQ